MKKIRKVFTLLLTIATLAFVVSCNDEPVTVESIVVVENTVPAEILTTEIEPYVISIVKNLINNEEFIEAINEQLNTKVDTSGLKATKENYKKKRPI